MVKKITIVFVFMLCVSVSVFSSPRKVLAVFDCTKDLTTSSTADQRQYCQTQLDQLNAQLVELNQQLADQKKQTGTISGDIDYLTSQINALTTKIKSRTLAIATLKVSISDKAATIETLAQKIDNENQSLAQLLRNTNEFDNENVVNLLLSDQTISNFYSDLESYASIKEAVKTSVDNIIGMKTQTEAQKADLQKQQNAEIDAKAQLVDAQNQVAVSKNQQKQLLAVSKQKESDYNKIIADEQAKVAQIKARLFQLAGGAQAIRFDVALGYAEAASAKTGIDPAFLLAILTQESNLGSNVGQCYLRDSMGSGVNVNTGRVWPNLMHPVRDVPIFLSITNSLGFNAFKTVVSCPIAGVVGYGGAMGPAQFIPSTWNNFSSRVSAITGSAPANPWLAPDAFTASALYLTDLGAIGDSASAQSRAACKYYGSGGFSCSYSRSVLSLKSKIQSDINYLQQYGVAKN